jgi:predicted alpha-1,6-mannanase (GH76 family)
MPQCDKSGFASAKAAQARRSDTMRYSVCMASGNDDKIEGTGAEFDKLARRYLDLWQAQLAGLASDQAVTEQIARLFAAANTQVAQAMQVVQGAPHAGTTRPPPAAAPSGNGSDDLGELRKRVEALEARLAELESRTRTP